MQQNLQRPIQEKNLWMVWMLICNIFAAAVLSALFSPFGIHALPLNSLQWGEFKHKIDKILPLRRKTSVSSSKSAAVIAKKTFTRFFLFAWIRVEKFDESFYSCSRAM